jgi:cytosine/adenosine deaminase-related metal-dependent hydrolase
MVKQVFSNAVILEGEELEVVHGYLAVRDDVVERISEGSPTGRATDLKHGFILPPFVNSHTHVVDSVAKEFYLGKTQPEVVGPGGEKFRALSSSSFEDLATATRATLLDMLRTGTVAHCDFREGGVGGVNLMRRVSLPPLRSIIMGRPLSLSELSRVLARADGVGLPSLDEFNWEELFEIASRTHRANKLLSVHVAETKAAQESSLKSRGVGEVERALELKPTFVVHATHADEQDFSLLKKKNVPVVFCPRANNLLGTGSPPIHLALATGTKFCLGTDNAMVCQPNIFEELSFAWACLRSMNHSAGSEEARELLRAATVEAMKVFGLPWGGIRERGKATFLILARGENLFNVSDVYSGLVNRARPDNLRAVYVDGKKIFS